MNRDDEPLSVIGAMLWFLYRSMSPQIRGLVGVIILLASLVMAIVGWYLWGVVTLALGISLLAANGMRQ